MNSGPVVNLQKRLYLFFIEWISFSPSLWSVKFTTKKSTVVFDRMTNIEYRIPQQIMKC